MIASERKPQPATPHSPRAQALRIVTAAVRGLVPVAALLVAFFALRRLLDELSYRQIVAAVRESPASRVVLAVGLSAGSYLMLVCYELLGLRYAGARPPLSRAVLTGFCSYAVSNTLGNPLLTSTPLRFRMYSAAGLSTLDVVKVVSFGWVTFWLGLLLVGGSIDLVEATDVAAAAGISPVLVRLLAFALLALALLYAAASVGWRGVLRFRAWRFDLPSPPVLGGQLVVSSLDWLFTAGALYALLPEGRPSFAVFLSLYVLALVAGLLSHVPGGLGVFDTTMAFFLAAWIPTSQVAGAVIGFRVVYYLLPFGAALAMLIANEVLARRARLERWARTGAGWVTPIAPSVLALSTFVSGALLIISGSTPELSGRLRWLGGHSLPLPVFELSHLLASVAGAGLLLLAQGLRRRLDAAFYLTAILLATGVAMALLRGLDWEEASILLVVLLFLVASRREFYRKASLLAQPLSPRWLGAVALVLACALWLGLFTHRRVEYRSELWWQFSFDQHAPRFLRASFATTSILALVAGAMLLRPAPAPPRPPNEEEWEVLAGIARASPSTVASLALLGDKSFLFNERRSAFVMYGLQGDSCIAMGDPVGPESEWPELVWAFRELCDRYHERPVFYQVEPTSLPLYVDVGLAAFKLGEAARVPLSQWSLEGASRKNLRHAVNRARRDGLEFAVIPQPEVAGVMPELERVSSVWLREKNAREKSFSLGSFRQPYAGLFPYAVARRGGRIVAFANMLGAGGREELSIDLMRHDAEAPPGVMDFLFCELMSWGRDQGYAWFNLGMAPLAGLERHELAPLWNRIGNLIFRHGEQFYNFQGLRDYKNKFDPVWEARYLAAPGGLAVAAVLLDVAALIAGGVGGLVGK